ncbi:MAG: LacI family DNA-binding transcriptional regulator [Acidobacteriaceae bacterium]|nr:LacI family DNA-binding transcriptional regulator [Acidobacteriaceae bacterium]
MKPPGIRDIAKALGISIGTVDRALHGRSEISPTTRDLVLKKAEQLGYQPNVVARSLKLSRRLRIGVYFPRQIVSFFDSLRAGVRDAAATFPGVNIELVFRTFPRLDEGDLELFDIDTNEKFDGILVAPGNPDHIGPALSALASRGVAVVCVASDAPGSERLASVTADADASGAIAADLFSKSIQKSGRIATIIGGKATLDHAEKLSGFATNLAAFAPHLSLLPAIESHEKPNLAYRQAVSLFSHKPYPLGIYISTANSIPVMRALTEQQLLGKVQIITTDLFPALFPFIESGAILATLYQRPFAQGKIALQLLLRYLLDGVVPESHIRLAPHIVLRGNLALFSNYFPKKQEQN